METELTDIEIDLGQDVPDIIVTEDDGNPKVVEQKPEVDDPQHGIEALKRELEQQREQARIANEQREAERRARMDAERLAAEAAQRATVQENAAKQAALESSQRGLDSIGNALVAAEREQAQLESLLAQAHEKGDFTGAAKVQGQLSKVAAQIVQYEGAKSALEAEIKAAPEPTRQSTPKPEFNETQEQKIEGWLTQRTKPTADWLRQHMNYFSDQTFQQRVNAADAYLANIKNVVRDTPQYFDELEKMVGLKTPDPEPVTTPKAPATQRTPTVPAAPVSRTNNGGPLAMKNSPTRVVLNKDELELAEHMFRKEKPTDEDPKIRYARHKAALQNPAERARFMPPKE